MTIVITREFFFDGEAARIVQLLSSNMANLVHIRKPQATKDEVETLIRQLPSEFYHQLVLHDHHSLAIKYGLRGIHLNHRNPHPPDGWKGSISISCHSISELAQCRLQPFDYLSLSPIFDSISKQGYRSAFTASELAEAHRLGIIDQRVMAMGGVTFSKIHQVLGMGFGGAMILGDAWK